MWWDKSEVKLTNSFALIDKNAGRQVHTDVMKSSMLNSKIRSDFLVESKANIEIQMNMQPSVMKYKSTLSNYRKKVNQRHPNANNTNNNCRRIHTLDGCEGRERGGGRGSGRGGQGGRRHGSGNPNACCNDEWKVTGINGNRIKVNH